ncbi:MAG: DsbA family oxidoreductase, partial [Pedobacter sp.]
MKVEIWSDVMCPFCYIGKRKFEGALEQFKNTDNIEIVWKSFQLAPDMQTDPDKSIHQFLAEHKGLGLEQAKEMNEQVANYAAQAGLDFNFDQTVPANSFNAHRFAHFAKHHGLQDKAEEALFKAYFTDGKNIDDIEILVKLGQEIGLSPTETRSALESSLYANNVRHDINEARQLGVRGVPFFVFDRKVAVSGAQGSEVFLQALKKT